MLFFDSLGTDDCDEAANALRKYLAEEYKAKFQIEAEITDNNMPYFDVDVPKQDNEYDSGIYLLQYAESFFKVKLISIRIFQLKKKFCVT